MAGPVHIPSLVGGDGQHPQMWGELLEKLVIIKGLVSYRGDSPEVPKSLVKKSTPT
ncbi:MAG TPA: hypothetical protein VJ790_16745 [Dongiaceae bacterium]|nr:hypothetical protein [Dongiaceae bacterium]